MAEKPEHSSARDSHSCASKLVCPVSLVSLLICTAAFVRVEIINQRVHDVEDSVAGVQQIQNLIKVSTDEENFKHPQGVESVAKDHKSRTKERRDEAQVYTGRNRRSSSEAGTKADELTMESVRSEINKTLSSLTSRSVCLPKQQICVPGPPGVQGPKGSRGRRGPRGVTGKKGSRGNRGEPGPHGKKGTMGPPGPEGGQGKLGSPGPKGDQGMFGLPGPKGEQGITGPPSPKGEQGIVGPPGQKGEHGNIGSPGLKGRQGIMGPKGTKGVQGNMGTSGPKGIQGIMGPKGTKGEQGIMGTSGTKGKQGIMGPKGTKGEKGRIGVSGPRGVTDAKVEFGASFSLPAVVISPMRLTIVEKLNAVFQCSASGNPKPIVGWLRKGSTSLSVRDGRLEVHDVTLDDSGEYTCFGINVLGTANRTAILTVRVRFTTNGGRGRYGTIQKFTVPRTAQYRIEARGARGGTHTYNYGYRPGTYYGGYGASAYGTFRLTKGTVLNIVVGQRGGDSVEVNNGQRTTQTAAQLGLSVENNAGTGGGGGSFVYTTSNTLLLAAGGGGGASAGYNGMDGQKGTSGTSSVGKESSQVRKGGTGGQPGECNSGSASYHGGVGAGWYAQGCDRKGSEHGERGGSRAQGWIGGQAGAMNSGNNGGPSPGAVGGFGGGGGGSEDNGASGGGGGYSGGGSGTHENQAGGGGGSYCGGRYCYFVTGGNVNDDGLVQISVLSD